MRRYLTNEHVRFAFRQSPKDFIVEEIPLAKPSGRGEYLWCKVQKTHLSTWQLVDLLQRYTGEKIGYAGLKDKNATTIQYLTIPKRAYKALKRFKHSKIKIVDMLPTSKPLKMGELAGNRFRINIYNCNDVKLLKTLLKRLPEDGVPNYFGYQRFGNNALSQAKALLEGEFFTKDKRLEKLLFSVMQSHYFNGWLAKRVAMSAERLRMLEGDIIEDGIITGLLPGKGVQKATKEARAIEKCYDCYIPTKGYRRAALFFPKDITIQRHKNQTTLLFSLPKGSYATILLENLAKKEMDHKGFV